MPECKDWITYVLTIIGIVVTAWFSYRVLKATEATNKVTAATLELSKQMNRIEEERKQQFERNMRQLLLPRLLKQSNAAYHACVGTEAIIVHEQLQKAPTELGVPEEELAKYFPSF
ncbi:MULTISPECIES: hypothetical protein [Priestia]|uniref:hypothetical protein n=1 Tax=Priestia TaxID=2800373 RepID=UPI0018A2BA49|nr:MULTISPECIES: hypothetical protein [Priestia]QTL51811.1 hypothetical protein J5Z55_12315 [Priestia aryabhattai]